MPVQATTERTKKPLDSQHLIKTESKDEIGTKRQSKCAARKLRELPVRRQFIVQVYPYILKHNFYLPLGTVFKANYRTLTLYTEHSLDLLYITIILFITYKAIISCLLPSLPTPRFYAVTQVKG